MNHTVKVLVSIVIISAAIIGISSYSMSVLTSSSNKIKNQISEIETSAAKNDWEKADYSISVMEQDWEHIQKHWAKLIDHMEIDKISDALSRLKEFVKSREPAFALAEASLLKQSITHIPEKEALSLENIF